MVHRLGPESKSKGERKKYRRHASRSQKFVSQVGGCGSEEPGMAHERKSRASLDRTAEGGCPHMSISQTETIRECPLLARTREMGHPLFSHLRARFKFSPRVVGGIADSFFFVGSDRHGELDGVAVGFLVLG